MTKASCYLRVSTDAQSVDGQLPAILEYCRQRGYSEPSIYSENETAWRAGHQRELARLLNDLRSGRRRYDLLIVWSLDRLSRQGAASILNLVDSMKVYGCRVVSLQEPWTELPGELGEVLFAIAGWVAKMESQRRSERTKAGLARVRAAGKQLGRPRGSQDKRKRRRRRFI